jgi:hypothetical protein
MTYTPPTLAELTRLDWHTLNHTLDRMPTAALGAITADRSGTTGAPYVRARCLTELSKRDGRDVVIPGLPLKAKDTWT